MSQPFIDLTPQVRSDLARKRFVRRLGTFWIGFAVGAVFVNTIILTIYFLTR